MDAWQQAQMDSQDVKHPADRREMASELQGLVPLVLPLTTAVADGGPEDDTKAGATKAPAPGSAVKTRQAQQQHAARSDDQHDQPQPRRVRQMVHLAQVQATAAGAAAEAALAVRRVPGTVCASGADADDTDGTTDSVGASAGGPGPTGSAGLGGQGRTRSNAFDTDGLDPRRAKRILANRQSAQRSRMKRLQHVHDLESQALELAAQVRRLQDQLSLETRRANEASAAAESAAAAAALLQQQVEAHAALSTSLQEQLAMLRNQATAGLLAPPKDVGMGSMLPPAQPHQSLHHQQAQMHLRQQVAAGGLVLPATTYVGALLPLIGGSGNMMTSGGPAKVGTSNPVAVPPRQPAAISQQPQQRPNPPSQPQLSANQHGAPRSHARPVGLPQLTVPAAVQYAGPLSPLAGNRIYTAIAPGATGPGNISAGVPGGGGGHAPGPGSAARGLPSPVTDMDGDFAAMLGDSLYDGGTEDLFDGGGAGAGSAGAGLASPDGGLRRTMSL